MRAVRWIAVAIVAVVVLVLGGTWLYINVIRDDPPARLTFEDAPTTTVASGGAGTTAAATATSGPANAGAGAGDGEGIEGTWTATTESQLGYRVKEILFGQSAEGVGRTNAVTGQLTIAGTTVSTADFSVDMATVQSDEDRRDSQFRGRIMDVEQFPTATFRLTQPIDLGKVPAEGEEITASATGDLTLRGTTKSVTFPVTARLQGGTVQVNGSIPIVFADWGIPNPSNGPVSTDDNGLLEFLLVFQRAA